MTQYYSGHGSAYWASKAFCGLLLPADHPAWTHAEEPMAVERGDFCVAMPAPGFVARGTAADGVVRIASHGSDHFPLPTRREVPTLGRRIARRLARSLDGPRRPPEPPYDAHYAKLAYSTHAAASLDDADIDSQISLRVGPGERSQRRRVYTVAVADRYASSVYYARDHPDVGRIETASIAHGRYELRVHHVSCRDGADVRDGGFSVAAPHPPEADTGDGWARVHRADGLTSAIVALHGYDAAAVHHHAGGNAIAHHAATPYLRRAGAIAPECVLVSLVDFGVGDAGPDTSRRLVQGLEVSGRRVVLRLGEDWWLLQLLSPEPVELELGGRAVRGAIRVARVSPDGSRFALGADGEPCG
jgi:hypothetical protein